MSNEERSTYNALLKEVEDSSVEHRGRALYQLQEFIEILLMKKEQDIFK